MTGGFWTLGRVAGAPIRVHWSLLLGALIWSGFRFEPAFWLGFAAVILIHELGHAFFVLRYRLGLREIVLHGAGGYCAHGEARSRFEESVVAWGGVLAQLAAFAVVQAAYVWVGPPRSYFLAVFLGVFGYSNLWLAALNLIPVEPLDGAKAWPLVGMLVGRLRGRAPRPGAARPRTVDDELRDLTRLDRRAETANEKTDRIVRDLIARTTQSKDR